MAKRALVILAEGAEEMEVVITVDTLRRSGVEVTVAGLSGLAPVKCSRSVIIQPDLSMEEASNTSYDAVILPGGLKGAEALGDSEAVGNILKQYFQDGRIVAAICAAPTALQKHGIAKGKRITSYPSMKERLISDYQYEEDRVVIDGNLTTSRGPGTAFEFALSLAEQLVGTEKANPLIDQMLLKL